MFLDFKKIEHTEEWVLLFQQKVDAYVECFIEVKKKLPKNVNDQVIDKIVSDLIHSTNMDIGTKYKDYYMEKFDGTCEDS
jgi:hypothetical protein